MRLSPKRRANRARKARLRKQLVSGVASRSRGSRTSPCGARWSRASSPRRARDDLRLLAVDDARATRPARGRTRRAQPEGSRQRSSRGQPSSTAFERRTSAVTSGWLNRLRRPPGDPRCAVAHLCIAQRGLTSHDSRQGAQRHDPRPGECELRDDLDRSSGGRPRTSGVSRRIASRCRAKSSPRSSGPAQAAERFARPIHA